MTYKEKYEQLVHEIESEFEIAKKDANNFGEPELPDKIEDRKLVIQYRNAVAISSSAIGSLCVYSKLLTFIKGQA